MTYYNTTHQFGEQLKLFSKTATNQTGIVLEVFKAQNRELSPSDVLRIVNRYGLGNMLLTSIRRSISNLTDSGKLLKTGNKKTGIYGKPEYLWKVNL